MNYILFGALIFWGVFFATPREGVCVACVLFAVNCLKLIRVLSNGKEGHRA